MWGLSLISLTVIVKSSREKRIFGLAEAVQSLGCAFLALA
jgi:hypothetical protein